MNPNCLPAETETKEIERAPDDALDSNDESLDHWEAEEAENPRNAFEELDNGEKRAPKEVTETEPLDGGDKCAMLETKGTLKVARFVENPYCCFKDSCA